MRKTRRPTANLPEKANKILNGVLVVLILIALKAWHLAVIQHEKKVEESKKPQKRTLIERSERAGIYDRFQIPLATNKVQYNALITYGPIRDLPRSAWKKDEEGKRVKYFYRKEYITRLCQRLAAELELDPEWLEDLIHSKAAILGNVPCLIKQNISEKQYFRLKMVEKDWPGVHAEIAAKRCYPLGPIGGEVVGYIGPISRKEYETITKEMACLREALTHYEEEEAEICLEGYQTVEEIRLRLEELEKKAYHLNDYVGKTGVEASCDEALRGLCGKHIYLTDTRGNFLSELPGSEAAVSGTRLVLTLSAELQEFAEQLLTEYESEPASAVAIDRRPLIPKYQPWIKGGAIVAMDPHSGEIYALASSPTFDPNDFIRSGCEEESAEKNMRVNKWLETEDYISQIWNMKTPYTRPHDSLELTWDNYLDFILPRDSEVRHLLNAHATVGDALKVHHLVDQLLALFVSPHFTLAPAKVLDLLYRQPADLPAGMVITLQEKKFFEEKLREVQEQAEELKLQLTPYLSRLSSNYDKFLLLDLYRLSLDATRFSPHLAHLLAPMSLSEYREATCRSVSVVDAVHGIVKETFFENEFKQWRAECFDDYLAERRQQEKEENKKYARPYIEYLEKAGKELFEAFWEKHGWELITFFVSQAAEKTNMEWDEYYCVLKNWKEELAGGAHRGLSWSSHYHALRKITARIKEESLLSFLQTLRSFEQLSRPLIGRYPGLRGNKEKDLASAFYPAYGHGFARSHAFRQAATIGSLFKLVPAYEALKQRFLAFKEKGEIISDLNPLTIIDDKHRVYGKQDVWNVGFTLDGRPIPMFYRGGRLPRSEHSGVGRIDLVRALEASSNPYFAMLAGDMLEDPEDLCNAANLLGFGEKTGIDLPGEYAGRLPRDITYNRTGLYAMSIGQHSLVGTPLQTAVMLATVANGGAMLKPQMIKARVNHDENFFVAPEVRWQVFLPEQIQNTLLTAMRQVVMGEKGTARVIRKQFDSALVKQIIGKTSTCEVIERLSLDGENGQMKLKHVWFGGISYASQDFSKPELIVIVYLRYGGWGKDAAPLAVEMVKKWREIQAKHK